jgi:hypothetical protein
MTESEQAQLNKLLPEPKLSDAEEGEIAKPKIKLEVVACTIGCGNEENRIKTDAFEIRVPLAVRLIIKEIMTRLGNQEAIPEGRYIPHGLVQNVGAEVCKMMLRMQNSFLNNFPMIPVFGITPQALQHVIAIDDPDGSQHQTTVKQFLTSQPSINGIEHTGRTTDLGKIFVKSNAAQILNARAFIDNIVKQLCESPSIPPELKLEAFNPPRRGDATRTSTNFQSHAAILANLGNPQGDEQAIPPWRQRTTPSSTQAQRQHGMQPQLQLSKPHDPNQPNQRNQQESTASQAATSTLTDNQTRHPNSTNDNTVRGGDGGRGDGGRGGRGGRGGGHGSKSVTLDTLSKFKEEMKNEFMQMIKQEAQAQVQTQMQAMQERQTQAGHLTSNLGNLTSKIDGMQDGIREMSLAETIHNAITSAMGRTPMAETENSKDGACP